MIIHYGQKNAVLPQRVLVYRDGVSEGSFTRLQACEIQSVRKGYLMALDHFRKISDNGNCPLKKIPEKNICPLITFVVCLTHNNVKVVPANANEGATRGYSGVSNVHSGTCVDTTIIDKLANLQVTPDISDQRQEYENQGYTCYSEPNGNGYDFLLTAHGAGLGTSKPVHYRIILNENAVLCPQGTGATPLTKEKLEQLTYEMSFQYSTATKVRLPHF